MSSKSSDDIKIASQNHLRCGECLRFRSIVESTGKCRLSQFEVNKTSQACKRFVKKIRVEKREDGWFVVADPANEAIGPFKLFNNMDATELGPQFAVLPKRIFEAILAVPESEVEKFPQLKPKGERKMRSQADKLILLCLAKEPELFHDQTKTTYVRIKQNSVNVTLPIRSKPFKALLANLLWQSEEKAPGSEALYGAINVLKAKALFEGKKYTLYNRAAPASDGFWIDMSDDKWRAIKATAEGWQIVEDPPILFKRYSHQRPLVEPKPGGDPWRFLDFVNIDEKDEDTRLLLLCAIISGFIPLIAHVIIVLYGIQGSGKSMLFKLIRSLIDPSAVEVLTLPRDERERVQQLDHHWCAFYDNVTKLATWMSDTLCRATTGGGFTKRELYTDDSDIVYSFKRCVGLNGINIAAQRGDLLDRALLVGLQNIPKNKRRTEKELLTEFENCKAEILGGFLDTLVKAIQLYPSVNPKELFRMADFTRWGCAIAIALGQTQEDFIKAYESKVKAQIEEAAHSSPVATVLLDYMDSLVQAGNPDGSEKWEGTGSSLYKNLVDHAKKLEISTRQKAWPKAPHILVRQLNELAPSLKSLGWEVVTGLHTGSARRIVISSVPSVSNVNGKDDVANATNTSFPSSSRVSIDDLTDVHWSNSFFAKKVCGVCGFERMTSWQADTTKRTKIPICEDCDTPSPLAQPPRCPECTSQKIWKDGLRYTKHGDVHSGHKTDGTVVASEALGSCAAGPSGPNFLLFRPLFLPSMLLLVEAAFPPTISICL